MEWIAKYFMAVFYREKYSIGWEEAAKKANRLVENSLENIPKESQEIVLSRIADRAETLTKLARR